MSKNTLLISVDILKERTGIHDNIDEKLIYPEIKTSQDMFIHPLLGTALYDKIISDITSTGTTTGDYKTLLDDYIIDALCYYTLSELPAGISYQFWNKGVVRKVGDNTELPDMSTLIDISNHYRRKAEFYGERLSLYLKRVSSTTVLPEYQQPGSEIDTIVPENSAFTLPVYLGIGDWPCTDLPQNDPRDKNNCHC